MADLNKVADGQPLEIPAGTWNAFIDAANWVKQFSQGGGSGSGGGIVDDTTTVDVKNISGQTIERFRAITLKEPLVLSTDNEEGFKMRVGFKGDVPHAGYEGRWGIVQSSLSDQTYGSAIVVGYTVAWINLVNVADGFVEIEVANPIPKSGGKGYGQIIWVAGGVGTATATGNQWAVLRLGFSGIGVGQYQYQYYGVVAQNKAGWDYVLASPALT